MLRDPYYTGVVTYEGEQIPGKHTPLISQELFDKVQEVSRARGRAGERRREHHHYLKGTVYCGQCKQERDIDRRLLTQRSVGKSGQEYFYYFCPGTKDGTCTSPHHNLYRVEDAVERHYTTKKHSPEFLRAFRALMADTVGDADEAQRLLKKQLDSQLAALDVQEVNLLDLAADGTVASAKIKARLRKIGQERERLVTQRDAVTVDLTAGARFLDAQLSLLENPHELYKDTTDEVRRRLNQAVFGAIYITDEDVIGSRLTAPHGELFAAEAAYQAATLGLDQDAIRRHFAAAFALGQGTIPTKDKETAPKGGLFADYSTVATTAWSSLFTASAAGAVSSKPHMVDLRGIEPLTFSLRTRRATNCATGPDASTTLSPRNGADAHGRPLGDASAYPAARRRSSTSSRSGARVGRPSTRPMRAKRLGASAAGSTGVATGRDAGVSAGADAAPAALAAPAAGKPAAARCAFSASAAAAASTAAWSIALRRSSGRGAASTAVSR